MELLTERRLGVPVVVEGSVITADDQRRQRAKGVAAAFGPASPADDIVKTIRDLARV